MTESRPPARSPLVVVGACVTLALIVAGWLLWTRAEPSRQGGYCANTTVAVADLLNAPAPDGDDDPELAALVTDPGSVEGRLVARLDALDIDRLQVNTPAEVRDDVTLLARHLGEGGEDGSSGADAAALAAFRRVIADYEDRCLYQ